MKTQTSKTRIWISSLLLLPIIAILFYSFAEKEYVEKENTDLVESIKSDLIEANTFNIQYVDEASKKRSENNDLGKRAEQNHYTKQFFKVKNSNGQYVKKRFYELSYENKMALCRTNPIYKG